MTIDYSFCISRYYIRIMTYETPSAWCFVGSEVAATGAMPAGVTRYTCYTKITYVAKFIEMEMILYKISFFDA